MTHVSLFCLVYDDTVTFHEVLRERQSKGLKWLQTWGARLVVFQIIFSDVFLPCFELISSVSDLCAAGSYLHDANFPFYNSLHCPWGTRGLLEEMYFYELPPLCLYMWCVFNFQCIMWFIKVKQQIICFNFEFIIVHLSLLAYLLTTSVHYDVLCSKRNVNVIRKHVTLPYFKIVLIPQD